MWRRKNPQLRGDRQRKGALLRPLELHGAAVRDQLRRFVAELPQVARIRVRGAEAAVEQRPMLPLVTGAGEAGVRAVVVREEALVAGVDNYDLQAAVMLEGALAWRQ